MGGFSFEGKSSANMLRDIKRERRLVSDRLRGVSRVLGARDVSSDRPKAEIIAEGILDLAEAIQGVPRGIGVKLIADALQDPTPLTDRKVELEALIDKIEGTDKP